MNRRTAYDRRGCGRRAACSVAVALMASFMAASAVTQESDAIPSEAMPDELRELIKEAYVYGFPMVDSYRIQYSYFVDEDHPEHKGPWNALHNAARVFTPEDRAIQTPNSDTPYGFLGADLRAEPLVISVPAIPDRYYSLQFIDMYTHNFAYVGSRATGSAPGNYLLARAMRWWPYASSPTPATPEDMREANALQDAIIVSQPGGPGSFEIPDWDPVSQKRVRDALIALADTIPDTRYAAGPDEHSVDTVRRIAAAASGWGLNPDKDAIYLNVFPEQNDGSTPHRLTAGNVPVDAFWSVSVYNADGYFEPNDLNAYSVNSVTGQRREDGSMVIQFGDCRADTPNCLPITAGWNYLVRLYRSRREILDGSWSFPVAEPIR